MTTPEEAVTSLTQWQMERYKLEAGLNAAQCWLLYGALVEVSACLDPKRSTSVSKKIALENAERACEHYREHFPEAIKRWHDEIGGLRKGLDASEHNYRGVVSKFDNCRATLAALVEHLGEETSPPSGFDGNWHEWLIERAEALMA